MSKRHLERLAMGVGAILTVQEATQLLPIADVDARRWLRDQGLVRQLAGRDVVVWRSVMDAVEASE